MATAMQWMSPRFESELLETEVRAAWDEDAQVLALNADMLAKREALELATKALYARQDELLRETKEKCGLTRFTSFEGYLGELRAGVS